MNCKIVGLAAVSTLLIAPAHAEVGRGPGPGKAYISIEGGYQNSDGPAVAAHGDLSTTDAFNPSSTGAAGVLVQPNTVISRGVTEAEDTPPTGQIVTADSIGGPGVSAFTATSTGDPALGSPSVTAGVFGESAANRFLDAVVNVFDSSGSDVSADAQGGPTIEAKDGSYAALTFGYGFVKPAFGTFDRIEVYGAISQADESKHVNGAAGGVSVDGTSAFAAVAVVSDGFTPAIVDVGPVTTNVEHSVDFAEFGARLKADRWNYNSALLTAGLEGFYAIYNQDTSMRAFVGGDVGDHIGNNFNRTADIDSDMVGVLLSLEGQLPIGGTPFSLIGRTFGGLYYLNADGDFRDNFGVNNVRDDLSEWGFRVGLEGGVRYDLSSRAYLSVTGSIDHFSDVATAYLPRFASDASRVDKARVETEDLTNYRVGARLTLTLGDDPEPFK